MRALFVAAALAAVAVPSATLGMSLAPARGQTITQTDLLRYLFVAPQRGDWLRYRVSADDQTLLTKTIGFGVERFGDSDSAFFETETQSPGLIRSPVEAHSIVGGTLVWKMFVDAQDFNDSQRLYTFVAGIIKIGDSLFRLGSGPGMPLSPAYHERLQSLVLYGTLMLPDNRDGTVTASTPQDVAVNGKTVHTVHTTVDFAPHGIGMAAGLPAARIETWQTTDVPLGIVTIRSTTNGHVYSVDLLAYGRGSFRSVITQPFETIRNFPG